MPITIFCPFTRQWAIDRWIQNLESLDLNWSEVSFVAVIDIDSPYISRKLRDMDNRLKFKHFKFIMNRDHDPTEVRVQQRRIRIAEVMNQAKELIIETEGDVLLCFEDDTVFENVDIKRLLTPLTDQVGFVEGVQCGRWGVKMIGAWRADDIYNPSRIETLLPSDGYEEITGGGFYGYACWKHLFISYHHRWEGEVWGPDVNFGFYIRQQGYKCLVDWQTIFKHNDHNVLLDPTTDLAKICYNKNKTNGQWERTDYETITSC